MDQQDLFGGETTPAFKPRPEHVRNSLARLIEQMQAADTWPWDEVIVELHVERTAPYLMSLLDADEAVEWRARFDAEIARLSQSAAA